jgi:hypothetical protein
MTTTNGGKKRKMCKRDIVSGQEERIEQVKGPLVQTSNTKQTPMAIRIIVLLKHLKEIVSKTERICAFSIRIEIRGKWFFFFFET